MEHAQFEVIPPSPAAQNLGSEAIRIARRILRRNPGTAEALDKHPELADLSAAAIVMLGSRTLRELLRRCRSANEIRACLEAAANDEVEGCIVDVDAEVVTSRGR
jgi:hypothetical protein